MENDRDFLEAFDAFVQAVRRARGSAPANDGLTLSQYGLLSGLTGTVPVRISDVASRAGITAPTATRILDALERRGIVERSRPSGDRRAVVVSLTGSGRELLDAQDGWIRSRQLGFYERLPDDERELVPDLLLRLATLIDELAAGPEVEG